MLQVQVGSVIDNSAQLLYSVTCSLVIVCCFHGAGQLSKDLTPPVIMHGTKVRQPALPREPSSAVTPGS
jgi:hypothetical protein